MRASSGQYYPRLDHLRGFAAFLVYFWHFVHISVPPSYVPAFPLLSIFEEGHTGVALFMTLSGYLFAKIVGERGVDLSKFFRNRLLRLAPLLAFTMLYYAIFHGYQLTDVFKGLIVSQNWPGGAWSISVETQFYVLFPLLILLTALFGVWGLVPLLLCSLLLRYELWLNIGQVQSLSYWTLVGCIDYFVIGMIFGKLKNVRIFGLTTLIVALIAFTAFWHYFNMLGGFYSMPSYPTPSAMWVFIPTVQGFCWAVIIISYEHARFRIPERIDKAAALVGTVSYSIYMLHIMLVRDVFSRIFHFHDFWFASIACVITFPLVVWISTKSYTYIERPFLKRRVTYLSPATKPAAIKTATNEIVAA